MNDQNLVVALTALLYDGRPPTLAPDLSILPIGLYARLSRNPDGTKESSAIQLEIGRRAAANAWPERKLLEFSDDDKSAANEEVWREHFYQLAKQVNDGQLGLVLVKEQTRLSRHKLIWP